LDAIYKTIVEFYIIAVKAGRMLGFILTIVVSLASLYGPEWPVLSVDGAGSWGLQRPSLPYYLRENGGVKSDFDSLNVSFVGSWPFGSSYAVTHDSALNLVFVGSGGMVYILDVSNPANPQLVSDVIRTRGVVYDLYYTNGKLYIACGQSGLEIWDVSDASNPTKLGSYPAPAYKVHVSGSYACVANGNVLHIIDISNPQSPQEMGYCNMPESVNDVYISGSYLYVADYTAGLRIVDITNPQSPQEVGYYSIPNDLATGVFVSDTFAYVIFFDSGLRIINVSNPQLPQEVGNCGMPIWPSSIYVSGSYAYVVGLLSGPVIRIEELDIINISNPQSPQEVGNYSWSWDRFFWVSDVCIFGSQAYVADGYGLRIINVSNP